MNAVRQQCDWPKWRCRPSAGVAAAAPTARCTSESCRPPQGGFGEPEPQDQLPVSGRSCGPAIDPSATSPSQPVWPLCRAARQAPLIDQLPGSQYLEPLPYARLGPNPRPRRHISAVPDQRSLGSAQGPPPRRRGRCTQPAPGFEFSGVTPPRRTLNLHSVHLTGGHQAGDYPVAVQGGMAGRLLRRSRPLKWNAPSHNRLTSKNAQG